MGMLHARRMFFCHLRRYSKIKFCCSRKSSYLCSHFMNARYFYKNAIAAFLRQNEDEIFGMLSMNDEYDTMATQKFAWLDEIRLLKSALLPYANEFLTFRRYALLPDKGKITREMADKKAEEEYKLFNPTQQIDSDFDKEVRGLLGGKK